jgi:hypothetical protein
MTKWWLITERTTPELTPMGIGYAVNEYLKVDYGNSQIARR